MMFFKGKVMNIESDVAHVFSEDGKIVRIKRLDQMRIGQPVLFTSEDIVYKKSPKFSTWILKLAVPALVMFMMVGLFTNSVNEAYAVLSVDINPSLTLYLNKDAEIIDIKTHNVDAEDLLTMIDSVIGMNATDAVPLLIKASDGKYITNDNDDVYISTAILKEGMDISPEDILDEIILKTSKETYAEDVLIFTATLDEETFKGSQSENISMNNFVLEDSSEDDQDENENDDNTSNDQAVQVENREKIKTVNASETAYAHANVKAALFKMTQIDNPDDEETTLDIVKRNREKDLDEDNALKSEDDQSGDDVDEKRDDNSNIKGNSTNANGNVKDKNQSADAVTSPSISESTTSNPPTNPPTNPSTNSSTDTITSPSVTDGKSGSSNPNKNTNNTSIQNGRDTETSASIEEDDALDENESDDNDGDDIRNKDKDKINNKKLNRDSREESEAEED